MFLNWCVKHDYASQTHRLFEADRMATESADMHEIEYFTPEELQSLLDGAQKHKDYKALVPVIALGALAGLRLEETLRLAWEDIWRVPDHIEIKASKAKTRSHRISMRSETCKTRVAVRFGAVEFSTSPAAEQNFRDTGRRSDATPVLRWNGTG